MRVILGYLMKDVVDVYLHREMAMLLLAAMAVFLLIVFAINRDFPRTVMVAGNCFIFLGFVVLVSWKRLAGTILLGILGVILIIVAGKL